MLCTTYNDACSFWTWSWTFTRSTYSRTFHVVAWSLTYGSRSSPGYDAKELKGPFVDFVIKCGTIIIHLPFDMMGYDCLT